MNGAVLIHFLVLTMPECTDCHWHTVLGEIEFPKLMTNDFQHVSNIGVKASEKCLLRGFTTVRDTGANCLGIKKCIDEGITTGPRIYPCGREQRAKKRGMGRTNNLK